MKENIVTKVKVNFLIPGVGPTTEFYNLDDENDVFCWSANERLSRAIITHQEEAESKIVENVDALRIKASRSAISERVRKRIAEFRKSI